MIAVEVAFISAIFVGIALLHGAYWDIKTRTAPKYIWSWVLLPALIGTTAIYILYFQWNGINGVLSLLLVSAILCPVSVLMAYKMRNGGDWRAMFYIALLTPQFAIGAWMLACIFGAIHICIDKIRKAPEKSAWMVSITAGFFVQVLYCVIHFFI